MYGILSLEKGSIMISNLLSVDSSFRIFLNQLTESIGFGGFLGILIAVEVLFIALFAVKSFFSYEARLKRILDKSNDWLFKNKKLTTSNIKEFNDLIKQGPKRFSYYWQQFILNREGGPTKYMTEENIIEKPLKTSSWKNNVRNLGILTGLWCVVATLLGFASQGGAQGVTVIFSGVAVSLILPIIVAIIGVIAIIIIRGIRVLNLDDIYHLYHIFARFVTNACDELPPYIDFNLLFSPEEIEKGNAQIREYYEEMARKAKEEFEEAQRGEVAAVDYNFRGVGVDGALLLERAMKESEAYLATKNSTLSQIAQVEAQKEALKRTYEDVQMDLQRKLQASKENIEKLIEQQATTTNRFDVGRLRERQDKEVKRQEQIQSDYDQEEAKYLTSKDELDKEIERLSAIMVESLDKAEKGMTAEYQSFFKKVLKSAYSVADNKVKSEKKNLLEEKNSTEQELINVQTQNKRLLDENVTLRARLDELLPPQADGNAESTGRYDEAGNFVYEDGSYHDTKGLFHDVDGKVYDMNGALMSEEKKEEDVSEKEAELLSEQAKRFGEFALDENSDELEKETEEKIKNDFEKTDAVDGGEADSVEEATTQEKPSAKKKAPAKSKKNSKSVDTAEKKTAKPRKKKSAQPEDIENINALIGQEEEKLDQLKKQLESQLDQALGDEGVKREKEELIASVEALKEQADGMLSSANTSEDLASINKRIEDLIKNISSLNND